MAKTPEQSDFTSIQQRIYTKKRKQQYSSIPLMKLSTTEKDKHQNSFSFSKEDYLQLVDETGRIIREDKRGFIPHTTSPILERLNINSEGFIELIKTPEDLESLTAIGDLPSLTRRANHLKTKFIRNTSKATKIYC